MGLPFNPLELWRLLSDRKKTEREKIAIWLEQTAADARSVADAWLERVRRLDSWDGISGLELIDRWGSGERRKRFVPQTNEVPLSKFRLAYRRASKVFDGCVRREFLDSFADSAGLLLTHRDEVVDLCARVELLKRGRVLVHGLVRDGGWHDLDEALERLNTDAAALEMLARDFRASR